MDDPTTCPRCGALVTPQLARCRRCRTYLHGTRLEGLLVGLLPAQFATTPGTGALLLFALTYFALMVFVAGRGGVIGFSSYTLVQLGGLQARELLAGQHWRYVTYLFGHHDVVHLGFNVMALAAAGPIVERLYNKQKMFLTYVAAGVAGGVASLVYYVFLRGGNDTFFVSAGASGAVCGLIGAALVGARRAGPNERELATRMFRWTLAMVLWGLAVPGINNAAHVGGFVVGAALAAVFARGEAPERWQRAALSVAALATLGTMLACAGFMVHNARGFPAFLPRDAHARGVFGVQYYAGTEWSASSQSSWARHCVTRAATPRPTAQDQHDCELAARALPQSPIPLAALASVLERRGDPRGAARLRAVGQRLFGREWTRTDASMRLYFSQAADASEEP
jgi:membrane associated rhomboid family serine protease